MYLSIYLYFFNKIGGSSSKQICKIGILNADQFGRFIMLIMSFSDCINVMASRKCNVYAESQETLISKLLPLIAFELKKNIVTT